MDKELGKLLKSQISLTEWLRVLNVDYIDQFSKEDVNKRETLRRLAAEINIPIENISSFEALEIKNMDNNFQEFFNLNADNLYAMSLLPKIDGLEKLRMRGLSLTSLLEWFDEQEVDHDNYRVNLADHPPDSGWATIFFVNKSGIHGEMVHGGHHLLTQGFHGENKPILFNYNFEDSNFKLSKGNREAESYLKDLIKYIKVEDLEMQKKLKLKFGASFHNNYLDGYFETTSSSLGTWFIDYNQSLGRLLEDADYSQHFSSSNKKDHILKGRVGSTGNARGRVKVINNLDNHGFEEGEILVCKFTSPDYLPVMKLASAIITDEGGTLSHAAIVARELGIPCVVATGDATAKLKDGDLIEIINGLVYGPLH